MRTFFDKPIRQDTTELFYPHKITVEEFVSRILNGGEDFAKNINKIQRIEKQQYPEYWMETFCAWSEIEQR